LKSPASRPDIRVAGEYNELRIGANGIGGSMLEE
jgi:hypothetical protein